jgi:hypothetical protein
MKYYNGARTHLSWKKMHRSRAPSIAPGTFFVAQPWADCITNMPGFNLRQAHLIRQCALLDICEPRLWSSLSASPHGSVAFIGDENAGCAPAPQSTKGRRSPMLRSRSHTHTFEGRLAEHKVRLEKKASKLKPGPKRDDLLKKAQQIDTAAHINDWLNSRGLQSPR